MAVRGSVIGALLLKPVALTRDITIAVVFGLGVQTDAYYAALTALSLAQSVVVGPLANHWIPKYLALPENLRHQYFNNAISQALSAGLWIALFIVTGLGLALRLLPLHGLAEGFLFDALILAPSIPIVFIIAWCGNKALVDGRPVLAQVVFASPNVALLLVFAVTAVVPLLRDPRWLPLFHWVAVVIAAVAVSAKFRGLARSNRVNDVLSLIPRGLSKRAYAASLLETLAFGAMQTALVVLPGSLVSGAGTLGGIISRFYLSTLSLVISPASQGLLYQASTSKPGRDIARNAIGLIAIVALLAAVGVGISVSVGPVLTRWNNVTIAALLPQFIAGYAAQFAAFGLITISARILSASGKPFLSSLCFGPSYALALLVLLLIHPAKTAAAYVFVSAAVLLPAAITLSVLGVRRIKSNARIDSPEAQKRS